MSEKLSKWLSKWLNECACNHDCHDCKKGSECARAYLQFKSFIEAQAEPSKEWIEEKAREMQDIIQMFALESQGRLKGKSDLFKVTEDFIRNLLKEAREEK